MTKAILPRFFAVIALCATPLVAEADFIWARIDGVAIDGNRVALCANISRRDSPMTPITLLTGEMSYRTVAQESAIAMYELNNGIANLLWRRSLHPYCSPIGDKMQIVGDTVEFVSAHATSSDLPRNGKTFRIRVGRAGVAEQLVHIYEGTSCHVGETLDIYARLGEKVVWLPRGSDKWRETALPVDIVAKTYHDMPQNELLIPTYVSGYLALYNEVKGEVTIYSTTGDKKTLHLPEPFLAAAIIGTGQSQVVLALNCTSRTHRQKLVQNHTPLMLWESAGDVSLVSFEDGSFTEMSENQRTQIDTIRRQRELLIQSSVEKGRKLTMTAFLSEEDDPEKKLDLVIPPPKSIADSSGTIVLPSLWPPSPIHQ